MLASVPKSHFSFLLQSVVSCLLSHTFPEPPERGLMTQARCGCGWRAEVGGTAQACLPWVEHLPGGHDSPACRWQPRRLPFNTQQDHRNMLSTTMVGTLVRGWRNRSSPRRAELKPLTPQRQGGIRIHSMWLIL